MGLQGALAANPAISAPAYPTAVSCTKLYIKEKTVWKPATGDPSFVAATPRTNYITTISTLTVSSTVPDRKPFKTASFVTTSTITTTTTFVETTTATNVLNYTSTTTTTTYAACATDNFIGPLGHNDSHIINVYNQGINAYATYDVGYSRNAEDCCIECHLQTAPGPDGEGDIGPSCMGSVFTDGRCLLLSVGRGKAGKCYGQNGGAGFFVSRPADEVLAWSLAHRGQRLPEFVLSNGPCGFFYDGGTAW